MQATNSLRTVIVTGANRGIGYAIIERLLSEKTPFDIIFTARNNKLGQEAHQNLSNKYKASTSKLTFQQLDISNSGSIDEFVAWIKAERNSRFDVLVNNAGFGYLRESKQEQLDTININFFDTVDLTEKLLPYLSEDGKIINVTSENGLLSWQGKDIQKILSDPSMTREKLMELAKELRDKIKTGDFGKLGWSEIYDDSKALLNAYTRWVLVKMIKGDQQCYCMDPGWCRTDMGGKGAPLAVERGADTPVYLIGLPFKFDEKYNGNFYMDRQVHKY